jgi:ornithine cyclodeaminase/alanine dehydrogenase-like protein (mu-crystallin family)
MLILSEKELIGLLTPLQIVNAVEASLRAMAAQRVVMPKRLHVEWNGNTLLAMPAACDDGVGVKIISVVPSNSTRGLPVTNGLMILNDADSGIPLALLNAAALTAQRTGAVGALGVKYMTPPETDCLGIVGCGVQGAWQAIFACSLRPIREVFYVSRSFSKAEQFTATVTRNTRDVRLTQCADVRELLERTSVVITATTSEQPVLPDDPNLLQNRHFISVGSYKPSMQELPDNVYRLSGQLVIDTEHAAQEVGDVINPIHRGILRTSDLVSIADYVVGERRSNARGTTVYKTVGAAIYDVSVAHALYWAARTRGLGREVSM